MTYDLEMDDADETMVDLGGGMVVPLRELMEDDVTDLRSHEPPRNSGEGTAVNGPMPLAGGDESLTDEHE
jgi:hypothetical protein